MALSNPDTMNFGSVLQSDFITRQLVNEQLIPAPTTYEEARDLVIKVTELAPLLEGFLLNMTNITFRGQDVTRIHNDEGVDPAPTLGYGLNLRTITSGNFDELFDSLFLNPTQSQQDASNLLNTWRSTDDNNIGNDQQLSIMVNGQVVPITLTSLDIIAGAQGDSVAGHRSDPSMPASFLSADAIAALDLALQPLTSIELDSTTADRLLEFSIEGLTVGGVDIIESREDRFDSQFMQPAQGDAVPDSNERVGLFSAFFNGEGLIGGGVEGAIDNDVRALAWWEIRFNNNLPAQNTAPGFQSRREFESDLIGIVSVAGQGSATTDPDLAEYKSALDVLFNGNAFSVGSPNPYEATATHAEYGVNVFLEAVATELDVLRNLYVPADTTGQREEIQFLQSDSDDVAATIIGQESRGLTGGGGNLLGNAVSTEAAVLNNLIFGNGGSDTIDGNAGNDFIFGGADNDTLIGGEGDDLLHGGDEPAGLTVGIADGIDVADYSTEQPANAPQSITVTLTDLARYEFQVTDQFGNTDQLVSIEGIVATDQSGDVLDLSGALSDVTVLTPAAINGFDAATADNPLFVENFDMVAGSNFDQDSFSFAGLTQGLMIQLGDSPFAPTGGPPMAAGATSMASAINISGGDIGELALTGFERIIGTDGNDDFGVFTNSANALNFDGGAGTDVFLTTITGVTLLGGEGADLLQVVSPDDSSEATVLDGGTGNDVYVAFGDAPINYVFGVGSGRDVINSAFQSNGPGFLGQSEFNRAQLVHEGFDIARLNDSIILTGLTAEDVTLEFDFEVASSGFSMTAEDAETPETAQPATFINERLSGAVQLRINGTNDTLYLGDLSVTVRRFSDNPDDLPAELESGGFTNIRYDNFDAIAVDIDFGTTLSTDGRFSYSESIDLITGELTGLLRDLDAAAGEGFTFVEPFDLISFGETSSLSLLELVDFSTIQRTVIDAEAIRAIDDVAAGLAAGDPPSETTGTEGPDELIGDDGDNILAGLAGDDVLSGGGGDDVLEGGLGADTLDGGDGIDTISYVASTDGVSVNLSTGTASGGDAEGDTFQNVENVTGSAKADTITGDDGANEISGEAGQDTLDGQEGNDVLHGGEGDDILRGDDGDDIINGDAGNDRLSGGNGFDALNGGDGNDIFIVSDSPDIIDGGEGFDRALLTGVSVGVTVFADVAGTRFDSLGNFYSNIERIDGTHFDDILNGTAGDDVLAGNGGDDTLVGGDGADILTGGEGVDVLEGGDGDDRLNGNAGNDILRAGSGNDIIIASSGENLFDGGDGVDRVLLQDLTEAVIMSEDAQGNRVDSLGNTYVGVEWIEGTDFDDVLLGTDGDDRLVGEDGNDTITGGAGFDILVGGEGADTFVFDIGDTVARDRIGDFSTEDQIDIGAHTFLGQSDFTGSGITEARYFESGVSTIIEIDRDGDGLSDESIQVINSLFDDLSSDGAVITAVVSGSGGASLSQAAGEDLIASLDSLGTVTADPVTDEAGFQPTSDADGLTDLSDSSSRYRLDLSEVGFDVLTVEEDAASAINLDTGPGFNVSVGQDPATNETVPVFLDLENQFEIA